MKNTTVAIFLILLIAGSQAANMRRNSNSSNQLEGLEKLQEHSQFGANLFLTLNLSLQSGGRVDEVIEYVRQAQVDAQSQRNELTSAFEAEQFRLTAEIESYETDLRIQNQQLDITNENIDELTSETAILSDRLTRLTAARDAISERQSALETARQNDIDAFRARQIKDSNSINALTQIIPALENLLETGTPFLEQSQEEVLLALRKIPENKPIQMLVQLSTKFNQEKLEDVIEKLTSILENIEAGKAQDEQEEQESANRFLAIRSELDQLWNNKQKEINVVQTDFNSKEQSLRHNVNFRENLITEINATTSVKEQTEAVLETTTETYNINFEAANQAVESLGLALEILTQNESHLVAQEENSGDQQEAAGAAEGPSSEEAQIF